MLVTFALLFGLLHEAFGVYILSGNPEHVVLGDDVAVTLTCVTDDDKRIVTWTRNGITVAHIARQCESINADTTYNYTCDLVNKTYYLIIPPDSITDGIHNVVWRCLPFFGEGSNGWSLTLSVPVSTVTITPAGDNNVVDIIKGDTQTFTCTTDSSRPAAWIQWYIGGQNVTNGATPQPTRQDGEKFISSSSLVYTGRDVDHNKVIFCEAVNIDGRQKVKSTEKSLHIQLLVTTLTITPAGDNNLVDIIEGDTQTFTCTTDSSRPVAWIQWYIGGQNVTNQATPQSPQQDGDKFISSSSLVYTGRDVDHNKIIFCQAVNIEGRQRVKSTEKSLYIQLPVTTVTITPTGDNNVLDIIEGETQTFTCTTDSSRPASRIQWYIGGQNVTIQAASQSPQQDGDKFISSSSLVYTGRDVDHDKVIFCEAVNIEGRQKAKLIEKSFYIQLPVTAVTITPAGDNNVVDIIKGETETFTCTTNSSRPAAWIQWYIGGQNVTNQATPQPTQQDGDKFISSSSLVYTGRDVDHNKVIFCEAVNIEGRQKVKSTEKSLYIQLPVTTVTLTSAGDNNVVDIIEGETETFTCTTDSSRPVAWIQWYIGGQNVTNQATPQSPQQDADKFISSSSLVYTGRDVDHNKVIFCDAVNNEGRQKVKSTEKYLHIHFQPRLNIDIPSSHELIDLKNGMSLGIAVNLLANPSPFIQWIFRRSDSIDKVIKSYMSINGVEYTSHIFIQAINMTQFGSYTVIATNTIGGFNKTFSVIEQRQNLVSTSQEINGFFAAGISSLVIGLLCIIFAVSFVVFYRLRRQTKDQLRSNDYTEFKTCTRCNPVVTDTYDSLETTNIVTIEVNENQTDRSIATYEEIRPNKNTAHTDQHQTKLPRDGIKKQEKIYDNMKS